MTLKRILIIGLVWPEPTSSAAGTRMIQLINLFLSKGFEVVFASAASKSDFSFDLKGIGVTERDIKLNDESFNDFLREINPDVVMFDRFMVEEQYGWRVQQECPDAFKLLDTEDLHALRHARQQAAKKGLKTESINLFTDMAKREIASILRCDLSLIISKIEMGILSDQFKVDSSLIYYLPFLEEEITAQTIQNWKTFEERKDFIFIGNFLHEPNWHTVQFLKAKIWPQLRKKLPGVSLNIYGAYASQKVLQLNNSEEKFYVHGRAKDARDTIAKHRILLAPIQFGAGVKGKFVDAMQVGTPSATTSIGAEAMKEGLNWNGIIEDDSELFIQQAAALYQNKNLWLNAQKNGVKLLNQHYGKAKFEDMFIEKLQDLMHNLNKHREHNFIGQILQYHTTQSTRYMSLWIEEKNKNK
ncbi:glycosyltransferase [Pedobacter punctiformis]|nr:glycosyltransferase [Pedobacter sp. HCMS5-2]